MKRPSFLISRTTEMLAPSSLPLRKALVETKPNGDKVISRVLMTPKEIVEEANSIAPISTDLSNNFVSAPLFMDKFEQVESLRGSIDSFDVSEPVSDVKDDVVKLDK